MKAWARAPLVALVVASALVPATTSASAERSWSAPLPASTAGAMVDAGRIWWVVESEASGSPRKFAEKRAEVHSRALAGGTVRRTPLAVHDLVPPSPEFVRPLWFTLNIDSGVLVGTIVWSTAYEAGSGAGGATSPQRVLAQFDLETGRLLRTDATDRASDRGMLRGSPALLGPINANAGDLSLVGAIDGRTYGARAVGNQTIVAERWLATFEGTPFFTADAWANDAGWLRVSDLVSGTERYRVRARQIRRRAGAARAGREATTVALQPDGGLQTTVRQTDARRGLRPTWVDRNGRVRSLPWTIPSAVEVLVSSLGGRVIVQFRREAGTKARPTACEGHWIFNRSGTRGRQLAPRDRATLDWATPLYWDRRFTVFQTMRWDGRRPERHGIHVEKGLASYPLPKAGRPSCKLRA